MNKQRTLDCSGLGFSAECAKYSPFTICQNTEIGYRCCMFFLLYVHNIMSIYIFRNIGQDMCEHEGFSGECQVTTRSEELPVCRKLEYGHDCCMKFFDRDSIQGIIKTQIIFIIFDKMTDKIFTKLTSRCF